jgi:cell division transport system permease protein
VQIKEIAMVAHRFIHLIKRAMGGIRRRPWLHVLSVFTLAAAFLSFIATLEAALNRDNLLDKWAGNSELTVYLKDSADEEDLARLSRAVLDIQEVVRVETFTPAQAKERFAGELGVFSEMASTLPSGVFPSSMDVHLGGESARNPRARRALSARLEQVELIEEVELYDDWFERLSAISLVSRFAAWGLGLIALAVSILVVTALVRASVNARKREIEVIELVGATRSYVHFPFLLEGAFEAMLAMGFALMGLHFLTNTARELIGDLMPLIGGGSIVRLTPAAVLLLLLGSALAGLTGARISLRGITRA